MNKFIFSALAGALSLLAISSCDKEKLEPRAPRVTTQYESSFDKWLKDNLLTPYNIDYKYRFESNESTSTGNNVVPASLKNSMNIARTLKHTWLGSFDELAGEHFMRLFSPRIITLTGTPTINDDGTVTLGQAEGGLKISLTNADAFDAGSVDKLNDLFLHTMYHEFMHILHQNRIWDQNFSLLSSSGYTETGWQNRHKTEEYASLGFVTAYSARNAEEDITEVTACYITFNDAQWREVRDAAGKEGNAIIDRKIQIMKDYMLKEWKIDMDQLKATATKRAGEIAQMKLIEPEWEELINDQLRGFAPLSPKKAKEREIIISALLKNPKQLDGTAHRSGGHLCQFATQFRSEIAEAASRSNSSHIHAHEYHVLNK
ncbi:MAG: putative zinc-binding metallopeptidase [Porphyromonadaceae bacterium]|nr:putative zinc-binding metallopeptidase [Porphyromonadaceae bacterium]